MNILTYKLKNGIWLQLRNVYEDDEIAFGTQSSGSSSVSIDDKGEILAVGSPELQFNSALDSYLNFRHLNKFPTFSSPLMTAAVYLLHL